MERSDKLPRIMISMGAVILLFFIMGIGVSIIVATFQLTVPIISQGTANIMYAIGATMIIGGGVGEWRKRARAKPSEEVRCPSLPDLQASKSEVIRSLSAGVQRDKLIGLLKSGEITAWVRTKGYKNLRPNSSGRWMNDSLEYVDAPEGIQTTILSPDDLRGRPWRDGGQTAVNESAHDVYFNRAELKKHWPALF